MRLIDADKLHPDCITKDGKLAICQSQLANAPTALFPLTVQIIDKVTDENIEALKQLMKEYKPQILRLEDKRPQGEWIYDERLNNWKCSECGETPKTIGYVGNTDFMKEHFKFCNHCGADMRKGGAE